MNYPLRMLIFGTSNFSNPLLSGTSKHWDEQDHRFVNFKDMSQTIISMVITYQMFNLKQAMAQKEVQDAITRNQIVFVHCLRNDLRLLAKKKKGKPLQTALNKLIDQYCETIRYLHTRGKIVIISTLMLREDSASNEANRHMMNLRIANKLQNMSIPQHTVNYDNVILPQEHLLRDGYHLNSLGVSAMIEAISKKLLSINNIVTKYKRY